MVEDINVKSYNLVNNIIKVKESFSYNEIIEQLKKEKCFLRISPCYTIRGYLDNLENKGKLKYNHSQRRYSSVK